jgi:hypothetical protein
VKLAVNRIRGADKKIIELEEEFRTRDEFETRIQLRIEELEEENENSER